MVKNVKIPWKQKKNKKIQMYYFHYSFFSKCIIFPKFSVKTGVPSAGQILWKTTHIYGIKMQMNLVDILFLIMIDFVSQENLFKKWVY
jgi:hypothetical protein